MPAYNSGKTIKDSIQSVLEQTYQEWELFIVNDGSSDDTVTIVEKYEDNRIKLINQKNGGVSNARNNALRQATGEYISFLDSDDLWLNNKLELQVKYLQKNNLKFVYTNSFSFRDNIDENKKAFSFVPLGFKNKDEILIYDFIPILTVLFHKSILKDIGYFDESLQGTEDWDYWIRILQKYEIGFLKEYLTKYRVVSTGLSKNFEKHFIEEQKVFEKHKILYNDKSYKYRLWFAHKKQSIIALQKKDYVDFIFYFTKLLKLPILLSKFLFLKYIK
jgi:glycosyltransferase involved in cell wall biosynthesis